MCLDEYFFSLSAKSSYDFSDVLSQLYKFIIAFSHINKENKIKFDPEFYKICKEIVEVTLEGALPMAVKNDKIYFYYNTTTQEADIALREELTNFFNEYKFFKTSTCHISKDIVTTKSILDLYNFLKRNSKNFDVPLDKENQIFDQTNNSEIHYFQILEEVTKKLHLANTNWIKANNLSERYYSATTQHFVNDYESITRPILDHFGLKKMILKVVFRGAMKASISRNVNCLVSYLSLDQNLFNDSNIQHEIKFCEDLKRTLLSGGLPIGWTGNDLSDGQLIAFYPPKEIHL